MRLFGNSHAGGRRSVPRAQAPLPTVLSTTVGDYQVALINISRTGARLQGKFLPAVGQQVSFRAADVHACAEIVWCDADTCAVEFDTPIASPEVLRLRSLALPRPADEGAPPEL